MRRIGRRSGGDHSMTRRHGTRSCASIKRTSLEFYGVGVFCACARSAVAPVRTECVVSEPAGIPAALHSTFSRPQPSNVSRYTFLVVLGFFVSRAPRPSRVLRVSVCLSSLTVCLCTCRWCFDGTTPFAFRRGFAGSRTRAKARSNVEGLIIIYH